MPTCVSLPKVQNGMTSKSPQDSKKKAGETKILSQKKNEKNLTERHLKNKILYPQILQLQKCNAASKKL